MSLLARLEQLLRDAVTPNGGKGPSTTKLVWLTDGLLSGYCATFATVGGVAVYVFLQKADGVYWAGVGALWINALGFASKVQRDSHNNAKDIAIAQGKETS